MAMSVGGGETGVMADINVTPMVDVMLVLLIIFMVVTPTIVAGFQAQLPEGQHLRARPEEDARTVLGIERNGAYYLNKKAIPQCSAQSRSTPAGREACRQEALSRLSAEFASHPEDKVLFVKADRSLKYAEMLEAMDLGRDSGARVMAAVTEQKPGTTASEEER